MPIYLLKFFPLESQAKLMIEEKMLSTYCKGEKKNRFWVPTYISREATPINCISFPLLAISSDNLWNSLCYPNTPNDI